MVAVIMDRIVFDSFVGISSGIPGQRTNASQCCHLVKMGKISTKVKSLKDIGYKAQAKNNHREMAPCTNLWNTIGLAIFKVNCTQF